MKINKDCKGGKHRAEKKTSYLYIAEGEIEERFFSQIKLANLIKIGRFLPYQLTQRQINDKDVIMTRFKHIYCIVCIIDTDLHELPHLDALQKNIKKLCGIADSVIILAQKEDFEDELAYILGVSGDAGICKFFGIQKKGHRNLKTYLAQKVEYEKKITKEHIERYCTRPQEFKSILENYKGKYNDIESKIKTGKEIVNDDSIQ